MRCPEQPISDALVKVGVWMDRLVMCLGFYFLFFYLFQS